MVKAKSKRAREEVDYESDDGFVENDDGPPKSKKTKASKDKGAKVTNDEEDLSWELSSGRNPRRVAISEFKTAKLISIREYYEKDEKLLPGKKGISLNIDQYKALLVAIPHISAELKKQGVDISSEQNDIDEAEEEVPKKESDEEAKPLAKRAKKAKKENIEETSEDELEEDGE